MKTKRGGQVEGTGALIIEVGTVNQHRFDVLILGAGAAGLMAAIEAGGRGRRVAVLERAERPGKKILISGGGRCNFTNLDTRPDNFISANPHFARSALARYTPADFARLVEKHGIAYHEKTLGQLFCDGSAQKIVDLLMRECADAGVRVLLSKAIQEVGRDASSGTFRVVAGGDVFMAPKLVVATGGLSIPQMGRLDLATTLLGSSGLPSSPAGRHWFRWSSPARSARISRSWRASQRQ